LSWRLRHASAGSGRRVTGAGPAATISGLRAHGCPNGGGMDMSPPIGSARPAVGFLCLPDGGVGRYKPDVKNSPARMFELHGEFFPIRRQHDQRSARFLAGGFIGELEHRACPFAIIFRTARPHWAGICLCHEFYPLRNTASSRTERAKPLSRFQNYLQRL